MPTFIQSVALFFNSSLLYVNVVVFSNFVVKLWELLH